MNTFEQLKSHVSMMAYYPKRNWDGQGGLSPTNEIIDDSIRILEYLSSNNLIVPSKVSATFRGTIVIAWNVSQPHEISHAEIEVNSGGKLTWSSIDINKELFNLDFSINDLFDFSVSDLIENKLS